MTLTRKKWLEREREMIKYFIVYEWETQRREGKANAIIETPVPIRTIDDINALQDVIKARISEEQKQIFKSVLITNIVRLED
jgi:hypothetical protein